MENVADPKYRGTFCIFWSFRPLGTSSVARRRDVPGRVPGGALPPPGASASCPDGSAARFKGDVKARPRHGPAAKFPRDARRAGASGARVERAREERLCGTRSSCARCGRAAKGARESSGASAVPPLRCLGPREPRGSASGTKVSVPDGARAVNLFID